MAAVLDVTYSNPTKAQIRIMIRNSVGLPKIPFHSKIIKTTLMSSKKPMHTDDTAKIMFMPFWKWKKRLCLRRRKRFIVRVTRITVWIRDRVMVRIWFGVKD